MPTPSPELYSAILSRIEYEKRLAKLKKQLFFYAFATVTASVLFSVLFKEFSHQATQSGFMELSSLIFSDFGATLRHFSDYLLSIADSLPVMSFAFVSVAILGMLFGAIKILGNLLEFRKLKHTHAV